MRYLPLTLLLGVLLTLNLGCRKKGDPDSPPATEAHPAITAANKILAAIQGLPVAPIAQLAVRRPWSDAHVPLPVPALHGTNAETSMQGLA